MKCLLPLLLSAFFITACDQKDTPEQFDCTKAVSKMTDSEKNKCGKGGEAQVDKEAQQKAAAESFRSGSYSKSPEKKW